VERSRNRKHSSEHGQVLPVVLALLAIGSITIVANLGHAGTSLKGTRIAAEDAKGVYAASAGVEHALWSLKKGLTPATSTPENINGMEVSIDTIVGSQVYTLFLDGLSTGVHEDWIAVSSNLTNIGGGLYEYTITVVNSPSGVNNKKVSEFGVVLPPGYSYVPGSAADYRATNLSARGTPSLDDPNGGGENIVGAKWIRWSWTNQGPAISAGSTYTQKFRMSGAGTTGGAYAWLRGNSEDIGLVGEISGSLTKITATARRPQDDRVMGKIVAEALVGSGGIHVFSWRITK
jgi:hypothetical protein